MRSRSILARSFALAGVTAITMILVTSCGSGTILTAGDGGSEGGIGLEGGGGTDAPLSGDGAILPPADAPFACGKGTCRVDQYCLEPCCGGPAPACVPANDGGGCMPGFHAAFCSNTGMQGCQQDPCTPPPPSCIDNPSTQAQGCMQTSLSRTLVCVCE